MNSKRPGVRDHGQGMTEFALVFPLLLLLLIGVFEFGRILFSYSVAVAATREAARYGAAIQDIGGGIPQYEDCQGIREAAKRIGKFAGIADSDITIQYFNDSGVYSTACPPSQDVGLADSISVTVSTSVTPLSLLGDFGAIPISSSSSRTILKKVRLGESGTGAGSISGALTDVNFKTTGQTAEETKGTLMAVLELNQTATDQVTIPFSVTGTATLGVDYTISASPAIINAGQISTTIFITLISDAIEEGTESLFIGINTPTNATKGPQNIHMVTIVDPPFVSFTLADSVKSEADGTTALNIVLSKGSTQDVIVPIVSGGTATWGAGADYLSVPNPVIIPAGSLSTMLTININNDLIDEEDEIAALGLGAATNAIPGAIPMHLMTILDDDAPPEISFFVPNQIVSEEIGVFTTLLTLATPSGKTITVPYTISGTTSPADYVIHDHSPLVIPAGAQTAKISMDILEGDGWEADETLIFTLGTPTNAVLGSPAQQTITITESSGAPTVFFTASSQVVAEENRILTVLVRMSNAWSQNVIVPFTLSGSAVQGSGQDYMLTAASLTIPVGYTQGAFTIQLLEDDLDEEDETIVLTMGTVINGTASSPTTHTIHIMDDDTPPVLNFSGAGTTKNEGDGTFSVTVTLDRTAAHDVTVPLAFSGTATSPGDYTASTSSLVIPAGALQRSFNISLVDDSSYEPNETVVIDLGSPTNAALGTSTRYTVTVEDDEMPLCEVGAHMLTVGTNSITWSVSNQGEALAFTGGSVSWPEAFPNQPRLLEVRFNGNVVFTGSEKPTSYSFTGWENFAELSTASFVYTFDGSLGVGEHQLQASFQNPSSGTTCGLSETFQKH